MTRLSNEYYRLKRQEYRKKFRAENRCIFCGKVPAPNSTRCNDCRNSANRRNLGYMKQMRDRAREEGRCTRCYRKLGEEDSGRAQCLNCRGRWK